MAELASPGLSKEEVPNAKNASASSAINSNSVIDEIQSQIVSFYDSLSTRRRMILLLILGLALLGIGVIVFMAQQTTWVSLFSGLNPKETSRVVQKLDEAQISYQLSAGGGGVLVPAELADQAKLSIADSDVLNGGKVGFEIFDNSSFTLTEFQQNVQLRRAMEGELARLIQLITIVDSAKVVLAIPEKTVFIDHETKPTAAVHLITRSGMPLGSKIVKTILNLVASGVPSLNVNDVKISDQFGNLYTSSLQSSQYETEQNALLYKNNVEKYLEGKIIDQLQKITGENGLEVKVAADIDTETQKISEELFDPDLAAIVSEQSVQEQSSGTRSIPIGVPGVSSNSPEIISNVNEAANVAEVNKTSKQTNYENSKRRINREIAAGGIKRITVSVLLDDKAVLNKDTPGVFSVNKTKWTEQELAEIKLMVQMAVGYNINRGDVVEVKNLAFNTEIAETIRVSEISTQAQREVWINIARYGLAALVIIFFLIFLVRPAIKKLFPEGKTLENELGLPATISTLEGKPATEDYEGLGMAAEDKVALDESIMRAARGGIPSRSRILEIAKTNTEETVNTVRGWLRES